MYFGLRESRILSSGKLAVDNNFFEKPDPQSELILKTNS